MRRSSRMGFQASRSLPNHQLPVHMQCFTLTASVSNQLYGQTTSLSASQSCISACGMNVRGHQNMHAQQASDITDPCSCLQPVYTIIDQVFGGVLASRVECQHCGQVSSMYDSMNDLSVEVDNGCYGVVKSVEIALGKFIQPEVMSGENAYHCDWCQR